MCTTIITIVCLISIVLNTLKGTAIPSRTIVEKGIKSDEKIKSRLFTRV